MLMLFKVRYYFFPVFTSEIARETSVWSKSSELSKLMEITESKMKLLVLNELGLFDPESLTAAKAFRQLQLTPLKGTDVSLLCTR
jgi:hypothetical protein